MSKIVVMLVMLVCNVKCKLAIASPVFIEYFCLVTFKVNCLIVRVKKAASLKQVYGFHVGGEWFHCFFFCCFKSVVSTAVYYVQVLTTIRMFLLSSSG